MFMSKHSKFLTILFIIMLTAALLSGCSQNQSEKSPDTSQPVKAEETINRYLKQLEALMGQTLSIEEPLTKLNDRLSIVVVNKK